MNPASLLAAAAPIMQRLCRALPSLLLVSTLVVPTLPVSQRNFDGPLWTATGRLNFLSRDTCDRYVRLNECSSLSVSRSCPNEFVIVLIAHRRRRRRRIVAPRAQLCWRRSPIRVSFRSEVTRFSYRMGMRIEFCENRGFSMLPIRSAIIRYDYVIDILCYNT